MQLSLAPTDLERYVMRLVAHHLPDGYVPEVAHAQLFGRALQRVEHCFMHIERKYYQRDKVVLFDHLNGDHMATLLYFFANTVWSETGDTELPTRLFYLNKILHGLDMFYSLAMPDIFLLVHPLGTVLGDAHYQDYLVVYQNCTVGAVTDVYPQFGVGTILYSRSSVLGNCKLGNDVVLAANSMIIGIEVPDSTVVVGQYPAQRFLNNEKSVRARYFDVPTS